MGTPLVHPIYEFLHIPNAHRCHASRRFVFRDRPTVAAAATFSRPSADLPRRHRHCTGGGRLSTPNKVILISYLV